MMRPKKRVYWLRLCVQGDVRGRELQVLGQQGLETPGTLRSRRNQDHPHLAVAMTLPALKHTIEASVSGVERGAPSRFREEGADRTCGVHARSATRQRPRGRSLQESDFGGDVGEGEHGEQVERDKLEGTEVDVHGDLSLIWSEEAWSGGASRRGRRCGGGWSVFEGVRTRTAPRPCYGKIR